MADIREWQRFARGAAAGAALGLAGCAQLSEPTPVPAAESTSFGVLDSMYDRSKWRWVKNADGRPLLAHTEVQKCFVDPHPDQDFREPGFIIKREEKHFGATRYEVVNVFEKQQFWIAVYHRAGTPKPVLGVYSDGACREAAERILHSYEKTRGQ